MWIASLLSCLIIKYEVRGRSIASTSAYKAVLFTIQQIIYKNMSRLRRDNDQVII